MCLDGLGSARGRIGMRFSPHFRPAQGRPGLRKRRDLHEDCLSVRSLLEALFTAETPIASTTGTRSSPFRVWGLTGR